MLCFSLSPVELCTQVLWNDSKEESLEFWSQPCNRQCNRALLSHANPPLWILWWPSIYDVVPHRQGGSAAPHEPGNQPLSRITIGNSRSQEFAHRHWKIIMSKSILSSLDLLGDKSGTEQMLHLTEKWFTKYSVPRSMQKALGCCECWLFLSFLALYHRQDHYYFLVTGLVPIPLK